LVGLRWHPWQEWYDLWGNPQAQTELFQFFGRYLKGEDNGWEKTPKVRMAVLKFGTADPIENMVVEDFPLPETEYRNLYLQPNSVLASEAPKEASVVSYDSESSDSLAFRHTFSQKTRLIGMPKAVLHMSCDDYNDMDVYVLIEKLDKDGKPMKNLNIPWKGIPVKSFDEFTPEQSTEVVLYKGPVGILRASHRAIDLEKSIHPNWPFHPHEVEEKVEPGTIVKLDIGIWAMGIEYEEGESLQVRISGRNLAVNNFGTTEHNDNKGAHKVHLGGDHASYVILPFVQS